MFLRHLAKALPCVRKYRLTKFQVNRFWLRQIGILSHTTSASTVVSLPPHTSEHSPDELLQQQLRTPSYFLQYFLNNSDMYHTVDANNINWNETKFQSLQLLMEFEDRSQDKQFLEQLEDCLEREVDTYDVEDIYKFIILISRKEIGKNSKSLFKQFDKKLCKRQFSKEDIFKIMFVSKSCLPLFCSKSRFSVKSTAKLCKRVKQLNIKETVQLCFLIPFFSKEIEKGIKYPLQEYLVQIIPQLNADELGIIAGGLLRLSSVSHANLLNVVMNKAAELVENMKSMPLHFICQLFEASMQSKYTKSLIDFQEALLPHVSRFSGKNLVSAALTGSAVHYINPLLWKAVANDFKNGSKNYSVRQIERLAYATTVYNIHDYELLNLAVKEFEAREYILKKPKHLIFFLYHLIQHNLYPEKLLSLILSENFHKNNLEDLSFKTLLRYCFLNCSLTFNKTEYNLDLIDLKEGKIYRMIRASFISNDMSFQSYPSVRAAAKVLEAFYGNGSVCLTQCLLHYEEGIVMRFDKNLKHQTIPQEYITCEKHVIKKEALNDDHIWIFIAIVLPQNFLYESETPVLPLQTMIRQLECLGYKLVLVRQDRWAENSKKGLSIEFLRAAINNVLEQILQEKEQK